MAEPWFDPMQWAWLPGTLLGVLGGLWGSLAGVLAPQGKARPLVLGLGWSLLGVSLFLFAAGLTALASGQPFGVWFFLLSAGLLGEIFVVLVPVVRKRYQEAEQQRMSEEYLDEELADPSEPRP